jgi:hypothetical protein
MLARQNQRISVCKSPVGFKKTMHYNQPKMIKRDKTCLLKILLNVVKFVNIDTLIKIA